MNSMMSRKKSIDSISKPLYSKMEMCQHDES